MCHGLIVVGFSRIPYFFIDYFVLEAEKTEAKIGHQESPSILRRSNMLKFRRECLARKPR